MSPSRRLKGSSIESLRRTLSICPGKPAPLCLQNLPKPTMPEQRLKVALTQELGQAASLIFHSATIQLHGTVLSMTTQNGTREPPKIRLLQVTFCSKVPPPPAAAGPDAVTQAEAMLKRRLTVIVYATDGCYWVAFDNAAQMGEWEKVQPVCVQPLPECARPPVRCLSFSHSAAVTAS